jgi:serine/threonine protein phosphatase PrpC
MATAAAAGTSFRFVVGVVTHPGLVRKENEDAVAAHPRGALWCVADGMGGHANGRWAAAQVVAELSQAPLAGDMDADCDSIADALADANAKIVAAAGASGKTIGSTVVALRIVGNRFACLWAGDSRIYRLRDGRLRQLTRDHSHVEQLVQAGIITAAEADKHPMANVITRAVGVAPDLALDVVEDEVAAQDSFVLCSDGLNKCLSDDEIAAICATHPPGEACDALLAATLKRGASDNVSIIVVRCEPAEA